MNSDVKEVVAYCKFLTQDFPGLTE